MEHPDMVFEICHYFNLKKLLALRYVNKLFNRVCKKFIKSIIHGKITPQKYFNMIGFNIVDFDYPITSFILDNGDWYINNNNIAKNNWLLQNFNEIYFYQVGSSDGEPWIIIGKSGNYYVYFTASCDYSDKSRFSSGFDCQGGGEFCYHQDWTTLWNMYVSDCNRKLMLKYYGLELFKVTI